jgi:NodT family efflux transporter outer membrane factor (OMF) lipoprotein
MRHLLLTRPPHSALCTLGLLALSFVGGCAVGPDFVRPAAPTVTGYARDPGIVTTVQADHTAQRLAPGNTLTADWWVLFRSPPLDAIVQQALVNNGTLAAADASLRVSQDNLRAGDGVFYPHVDAAVAATRQRSAPAQLGSQAAATEYSLVTASGTIGYALDVFGGKRRTVEGLRAQVDLQRYQREAAYVALSANLVNTVIAGAAYAAEIRATEQLLALEQQQLHATETQADAGTSPYSSVLTARSVIAASQALLAPLRQRVSQTRHLLASLEGKMPSEAIDPDIDLASLTLPTDIPVSLPSELVRQRPDILSAEAQLHTASANIGVATAAMFPSISLSGTYGAAGSHLGALSSANGRFWSLGPAATIPIFQGGSLWFGRKAAIESWQQAQALYRQTVLDAFAQVADSLQALEHDAEALKAQADAQSLAGEALRLLQANYQAGLVAYLDVLAADVLYHEASIAYLQAVAQRHQDTVALFVALGGGWWNRPLAATGRAIP